MPLLSFRSVTFGYKPQRPILQDVTFDLRPGRIAAILGPNGAGKTTLLSLTLGWLSAWTGEIYLTDIPLRTLSPRERGQRMALVPQTEHTPFDYTVLEYVLMGRASHLPPLGMPSAADTAIALNALQQVGLEHLAQRPVPQLSGGERQLMLLARALAQLTPSHSSLSTPHFPLPTPHSSLLTPHSSLLTPHSSLPTPHSSLLTPHFPLPTHHSSLPTPHSSLPTPHFPLPTSHSPLPTSHSPLPTSHLLILDEPTSHLDLRNKARLIEILRRLRDAGVTILMTNHEPDVVLALADDVLLMETGKTPQFGALDEVFTAEALSRVYDLPIRLVQVNGHKQVLWT